MAHPALFCQSVPRSGGHGDHSFPGINSLVGTIKLFLKNNKKTPFFFL